MGIIREIRTDLEQSALRLLREYRSRLYADAMKLCNDPVFSEDLVIQTIDEVCRSEDRYDEEKGELRQKELEEYGIQEGDLESIVNIPLTVADVRMSVMLKEDNGLFRVSVRSKRGTSAYAFAGTYFHGGGHLQASGGKLLFPGDIADRSGAAEYVENAVKEFFGRK